MALFTCAARLAVQERLIRMVLYIYVLYTVFLVGS